MHSCGNYFKALRINILDAQKGDWKVPIWLQILKQQKFEIFTTKIEKAQENEKEYKIRPQKSKFSNLIKLLSSADFFCTDYHLHWNSCKFFVIITKFLFFHQTCRRRQSLIIFIWLQSPCRCQPCYYQYNGEIFFFFFLFLIFISFFSLFIFYVQIISCSNSNSGLHSWDFIKGYAGNIQAGISFLIFVNLDLFSWVTFAILELFHEISTSNCSDKNWQAQTLQKNTNSESISIWSSEAKYLTCSMFESVLRCSGTLLVYSLGLKFRWWDDDDRFDYYDHFDYDDDDLYIIGAECISVCDEKVTSSWIVDDDESQDCDDWLRSFKMYCFRAELSAEGAKRGVRRLKSRTGHYPTIHSRPAGRSPARA